MRRSKTRSEELPLFAGLLPADPSHVWETLDEATRAQVVERLAGLLAAHAKADAGRSVPSTHPSNGVNTP